MNDAEAQQELTRMFFGFAGGIVFFIAIYLFRSFRIYLFGRRVTAVVVRVFAERVGSKGPAFGYLIEYHDPLIGARKAAREPQGLRFQEFWIGDRVTAFVTRRGDTAEILSWRRLALALLVIALVVLALGISYHFLIGKKISSGSTGAHTRLGHGSRWRTGRARQRPLFNPESGSADERHARKQRQERAR